MKRILLATTLMLIPLSAHANDRPNAFAPLEAANSSTMNGTKEVQLQSRFVMAGCDENGKNCSAEKDKETKIQFTLQNRTPNLYAIESNSIITMSAKQLETRIISNECEGTKLRIGAECGILVGVTPKEYGKHQINLLTKHDAVEKSLNSVIEFNTDLPKVDNEDLVFADKDVKFTLPSQKIIIVENKIPKPIFVQSVVVSGIRGLYLQGTDCPGPLNLDDVEKNTVGLLQGEKCVINVAITETEKDIPKSSGSVVVVHSGPSRRAAIDVHYEPEDKKEEEGNQNTNQNGDNTVERNGNRITVRGPVENQPSANNLPIPGNLPADTDMSKLNEVLQRANGGGSTTPTETPTPKKEEAPPPPSFTGLVLAVISNNQATFETPDGIVAVNTGETLYWEGKEWNVQINARQKRVILTFGELRQTIKLNSGDSGAAKETPATTQAPTS